MKRLLRAIALLLALVVSLGGCSHSTAREGCALDDGTTLDVSGRPNGLFGIEGDRVGDAPLAHFERMEKTATGVDASSGKRWIQIHLAPDEGRALASFTRAPGTRGIAVVVDGQLACRHKIRTALESNDLQLSCCDPSACARWDALLAR